LGRTSSAMLRRPAFFFFGGLEGLARTISDAVTMAAAPPITMFALLSIIRDEKKKKKTALAVYFLQMAECQEYWAVDQYHLRVQPGP